MPETMSPREKVEYWLSLAMDAGLHRQDFSLSEASDAILAALASSGDHAELARLAEAAGGEEWSLNDWRPEGEILVCGGDGSEYGLFATVNDDLPEVAAFIAAANPATVLALIAENAALRADMVARDSASGELIECQSIGLERLQKRATEAERKLAEAVGLLTGMCDGTSTVKVRAVREWLSKEAERG